MTTGQIISLSVTIGLGVIAIILAAFAIWLSVKFNQQASLVLTKIKESEAEIRSLVDIGLSHQKDFSDKMLDHLINREPYRDYHDWKSPGKAALTTEELKDQFKKIETDIIRNIEQKLQLLMKDKVIDKDGMADIRRIIESEIRTTSKETPSLMTKKSILPNWLREKLMEWRTAPEYYPLIIAIVEENVKTLQELEKCRSRYNFPKDYEFGIRDLLDAKIISGSNKKFHIEADNRKLLAAWIDYNSITLHEIIDTFGNKQFSKSARSYYILLKTRDLQF